MIKESKTFFLYPVRSGCIAKAILRDGPTTKNSGNVSMNVSVKLIDENGKKCAEFIGNYIGIEKS